MPAARGIVYFSRGIEIDTGQVVVRRDGQDCGLRPKTFRLLVYLIENRDRLVPKEELIDRLWPGTAVSDGAIAQCVADIRRALGETARTPEFVRTVPRLGYQFIGPVEESAPEVDQPAQGPAAVRVSRRGWRLVALMAAIPGICLAGALAVWQWSKPLPQATEPGVRTAILPFENRSGRPEMDWLRIGLADMLATSLSGSPRIALVTTDHLQRGLGQSSTTTISREAALRAARRAGAEAMITGAFAALDETVRLDVQIYEVSTGRLLSGESLTVDKPARLLTQLDPLAIKLAARLGAPFAPRTHLAEVMTNHLEAYRLYSLGLARTLEVRPKDAINLYEKAIELDPNFAMAYARIGFAYSSTWARPEDGKPYLEKAFGLRDRLTARDRLFIRAWYAMACLDYESAERAYREILAVFPMEVEAYHALGTLLAGDRRFEEAKEIFRRGLAIEPDMPQLHNKLSYVYFDLGEREKALESARRYLSLTSEPNAYDTLGLAYQRIGLYDEARSSYLEALRRKPDFEIAIVHLGNLYFQLGRYREALEKYREFSQLGSSVQEQVRGHVACSWVYWRKRDLGNAEREMAEAQRLARRDIRETLLLEADRGRPAPKGDSSRRLFVTGAGRGERENRRVPFFVAGYLALRDHRAADALDLFRAVLREPSTYWYIDPLETSLGDAFLELGRLDEAIAEYRRVLSVNPNYPMARYRLGLALEGKGMRSQARPEYKRFLTIWKSADSDIPELADARRRCDASVASVALSTVRAGQ